MSQTQSVKDGNGDRIGTGSSDNNRAASDDKVGHPNQSDTSKSGDDRRVRRAALQAKYNEMMKGVNNTDADYDKKVEAAIEEVKKMDEAKEFNITARKKAGKANGIIILNSFSKKKIVDKSEEMSEPKSIIKQEEISEENDAEIKPELTVPIKTKRTRSVAGSVSKKRKPAVSTKAAKQSETVSQEALKGLGNELRGEMKNMWRIVNKLKTKEKENKLHKAAKETLKIMEKEEKPIEKSKKTLLYDKFDQVSATPAMSQGQISSSLIKRFY